MEFAKNARRLTPSEADKMQREDAARIAGKHLRKCGICGATNCIHGVETSDGFICCECDQAGAFCSSHN